MFRFAGLSISWNQYVPAGRTRPETSTGSGKVILVALFHVSALALIETNSATSATMQNMKICDLSDFIFSSPFNVKLGCGLSVFELASAVCNAMGSPNGTCLETEPLRARRGSRSHRELTKFRDNRANRSSELSSVN